MMGFPYFISYLPTLLLSGMFAAMTWRLKSVSAAGKRGDVQFWIWTILYVVVMKGSFLVEYSTSPDEHQWIFSAKAFAADPVFWFREYFPFEVSRSWTVLPLGMMTAILGQVTFVHARVLFMLFFFVNVFLLHALLKGRFEENFAKRALVFFILLYCMTTQVDYAAYNSEMPALFFILVSLRFLMKRVNGDRSSWSIFMLGFFTVFIPFAKEQALYLALFLWSFGVYSIIKDAQWRLLLSYLLTNIFAALMLFSPLLIFGKVEVFVHNCLITLQYQNNGFGMVEKDLINPFFVFHFLKLVFLNAMWFFPFLCLIFFMSTWTVDRWFRGRRGLGLNNQDVVFVMLTLVVLVTIYLPRNGIKHYCIFLVPVVVWAIAFVFERMKSQRQWLSIGMYLLPFTIGVDPNFRKEIFPVRGYKKAEEIFAKDIVFQGMQQHVPKGAKVMIWGWANHYYNMFDCQRCSHFLYPQFAFGFYEEKSFVDDVYLHDLNILQPEYIVQAVGDKCFYFDDSVKFDMSQHHPEIGRILIQSYQKVFHQQGVKIYKRR